MVKMLYQNAWTKSDLLNFCFDFNTKNAQGRLLEIDSDKIKTR